MVAGKAQNIFEQFMQAQGFQLDAIGEITEQNQQTLIQVVE